jgi:hypothetical protein
LSFDGSTKQAEGGSSDCPVPAVIQIQPVSTDTATPKLCMQMVALIHQTDQVDDDGDFCLARARIFYYDTKTFIASLRFCGGYPPTQRTTVQLVEKIPMEETSRSYNADGVSQRDLILKVRIRFASMYLNYRRAKKAGDEIYKLDTMTVSDQGYGSLYDAT